MSDLRRSLEVKLKALNELLWDKRLNWPRIETWLENFVDPSAGEIELQRLHGMYLLSHFTFFDSRLMRALLRSLYRDLFKYPCVAAIRKQRGDSLDAVAIEADFRTALAKTRFIGIGNPSESGTHILYYFRQENRLKTEDFVHSHDLCTAAGPHSLQAGRVDTIVFLDDFCGSGTQAKRYASQLLKDFRRLGPENLQIHYYVLFATSKGLQSVRKGAAFDRVGAVCELDASFKCLSPRSRYFRDSNPPITREFAAQLCDFYGSGLYRQNPRGFGNGQLLVGFEHNVPNNSLPIIWSQGTASRRWSPAFRRFQKGRNW